MVDSQRASNFTYFQENELDERKIKKSLHSKQKHLWNYKTQYTHFNSYISIRSNMRSNVRKLAFIQFFDFLLEWNIKNKVCYVFFFFFSTQTQFKTLINSLHRVYFYTNFILFTFCEGHRNLPFIYFLLLLSHSVRFANVEYNKLYEKSYSQNVNAHSQCSHIWLRDAISEL